MCKFLLWMNVSKETPNKLRWQLDVEGVPFSLYIPKWRVPDPWPKRIIVSINEPPAEPLKMHPSNNVEDPISTIVERKIACTSTVRFAPLGDHEEWEIGEPYVPYRLLPNPDVRLLQIGVEWGRSVERDKSTGE